MGALRGSPFREGNTFGKGRPPGSRNKTTKLMQEFFAEHTEEFMKKLMEKALDGDPLAMRLVADRMMPPLKEVPIQLDMGHVKTDNDRGQAQERVLHAVSQGELTLTEGQKLINMIQARGRTIDAERQEREEPVLLNYSRCSGLTEDE